MKKYNIATIVLLVISLMGGYLTAQVDSTAKVNNSTYNIGIIARSYGDSIVFRWAPEDAAIWLLGNHYGWNISNFNGDPKDTSLYINPKPIVPLTLNQMKERFDTSNLMAGVAAQALYGKSVFATEQSSDPNDFMSYVFRRNQEQDQRQFLAYLAAESDPQIANALGLRYVDRNVKKGQLYEYSLSSLIPKKYADVPEISILVECKPYVRGIDESVPELTVRQLDAYRAIVYWRRNKLSGYYIERTSDKGKHWEMLNHKNAPIYALDPDEGTRKVYGDTIADLMMDNVVFIDSLELDKTYQYRVRGYDAFSDMAPYRNSVDFEMVDLIPPTPPFLNLIIPEKNTVCKLTWEKPIMEKDMKCFVVTFCDEPEGKWQNVSGPLSPKTFEYVDKEAGARGRGYYRIFAADESGNISYSASVLNNIEDVTPPAAPQGLRAMVDTTGFMYMEWIPNQEKDLRGYKVYYANQRDHIFVEASTYILPDNFFIDTLDITMLTPHIYYYVVAMDNSYNYSAHSDTLEVKFPDLFPPAVVLLEDYRVDDGAVTVRWRGSASEDVANYFIYRKPENQTRWECIYIAQPDDVGDDGLLVFRDIPKATSTPYNYCIEALDFSKKSSGKNGEFTVQVKGPNAVPVDIKLKATSGKNGGVTLSWSYDYDSDFDHYGVIYRSVNGGEFQDITTFKRGETTYDDILVKSKDKVSYYIQLVLGKGKRSQPSKTATVTVK